jgi:hypothetical protein
MKYLQALLLVVFLIPSFFMATLLIIPTSSAQAGCFRCCNCTSYRNFLNEEIEMHEEWLVEDWWEKMLAPAMRQVANQVAASTSAQTASLGTFINAQNQQTALTAIQEQVADIHSNYRSSEALCRFGTLSMGLARSQNRADMSSLVISERAQDRLLGRNNMSSEGGETGDMNARLAAFKKDFCDPANLNNSLGAFCGNASSAKDDMFNRDLNYTRTVETRPTLNINFQDSQLTKDEQQILEMSSNLFSQNVFPQIGNPENLKNDAFRTAYLDLRSIAAKRSVAENSFANIIGMRSASPSVGPDPFQLGKYFRIALQELGFTAYEAKRYLGVMPPASDRTKTLSASEQNKYDNEAPSYFTQMEFLTKKLYQDPRFYHNLMENPANVERQYTAMQSFGLMQQRDIYETIARSEMLLSILLELEIAESQATLNNRSSN